MAKSITVTLPKGVAIWPKLNEVDVYQPLDKKGKPNGKEKRRYITRLEFNDEDHRKVDKYLKDQLKKADLEGGKLPWREEKKDGKKTGKLHLEVATGEKYPPPFVDAQGNDVPRSKVKIGGGSILRVGVTVNPYDGFGGGINLYINFVQIIELKKSQRTIEVEKEEGFVWGEDADDNDDTDLDDADGDNTSDTDDDDIPF
jgi:hypothetical protein